MKKLSPLHFLTTFLLSCSFLPALAQISISGKVNDAVTGAPLAYVNIGVKGGNTGTISNSEGRFALSISEPLLLHDSLTFSAPGYQEQSLFIPGLPEEEVAIALLPAPAAAFPEVAAVLSGKWKKKTLGVKSASPVLHGMATSRQGDILEIAQPIKVKKKSLQLLTARLYLNSAVGDSCTFRVKIYASEAGQPGRLMAAEDRFVKQKADKGWITAELDHFGFIMQEDFFISFEFIPEADNAATSLVYGGRFGKGRGYSRSSSQGDWEEAPCSYAIQALVAVQR